jgi:hypothetical protein
VWPSACSRARRGWWRERVRPPHHSLPPARRNVAAPRRGRGPGWCRHQRLEFQFHEGVLLAAREGPRWSWIRYAQLLSHNGSPSCAAGTFRPISSCRPPRLAEAGAGRVATFTQRWSGREIRSVAYPLELVGAAHRPPLAGGSAYRAVAADAGALLGAGGRADSAGNPRGLRARPDSAAVALRPTGEITAQAEAISEGTSRSGSPPMPTSTSSPGW